MFNPTTLTVRVPQGKTLPWRDWIARSVRHRAGAPTAGAEDSAAGPAGGGQQKHGDSHTVAGEGGPRWRLGVRHIGLEVAV
jgi:hypothetical protein